MWAFPAGKRCQSLGLGKVPALKRGGLEEGVRERKSRHALFGSRSSTMLDARALFVETFVHSYAEVFFVLSLRRSRGKADNGGMELHTAYMVLAAVL